MEEKYYDGKNIDGKIMFKELLEMTEDVFSSPIKRWAEYCLTDKKIDIDVSKWAMDNYVIMYDYLKGVEPKEQRGCEYKYEVEACGVVFRGDTMTSFANFIRKYFKEKMNLGNIGKKKCANIIKSGEYVDIDDYMHEFAYLQHTQGNLIPVPLRFNVERSGVFADRDYWDLVMYNIYMWCESGDERYIYDLLNWYNKNTHMAESVCRFKYWMSLYHHNWNEFCDRNYLRAFVDSEGYPIEFWKNHFAFNRKIESLSLCEFEDSVKLINKLIKKRNEEINRNSKGVIKGGGVSN